MRSVTGYESNVDLEPVYMVENYDDKLEVPDVVPPMDIIDAHYIDSIFQRGNHQQLSRSKRLVSPRKSDG